MPYSNIDKPSKYFNTVLYTGTGANQTITVGFQPDWVWTKSRSLSYSNEIQDSVRGSTKVNYSDNVNAEDTTSTNIQSFNSNGYVQGSGTGVNGNGATFVSWNWLASNTTASNTSGTISSTVSANTTSGFSIVTYTGNGTSGATVGHGLGTTPALYIVKCRNTGGSNWSMYNQSLGNTKAFVFTATTARTTAVYWNNTSPTSTVFSLGTDQDVNGNTQTYVAYCFAEIKGYSKFSSYTGNGSDDGTFIYTGFKPAYILLKGNLADNWLIEDNKRDTFNPATRLFEINSSSTENNNSARAIDFLSNGFKIRGSNPQYNGSGTAYYYMCFAESPFTSSKGIPTTAR